MPKSMLVCGDENSPTDDGIPAAPQQPYDQKAVAAYIVLLKAVIRECHGNKDAVEELLNEYQLKAVELAKAKQ
ncbi:hypothetical protein HNR26_003887 [Rhizobium rosettiformans]|uniref:Uncharacterized protein n=2 Tax=Rhizobium rosettiformans TaxID=1368430 RepID=A0A4S8PXI9_9HYPH|nr:hypothetical protein [Rhizobium rosettiformans]MBB5277798.1 hypothetical protein [Rhizobium rosettiformans]THV32959.1 hypothetical protein FAA86_18890 [Rhizobium rosettiformans W3]